MPIFIGVCPLWDEKLKSQWMLPAYMEMLEAAGAVPVMMPLTTNPGTLEPLLNNLDGFLLTGGQDVDPVVYGQERRAECGESSLVRDTMDRAIIEGAAARDKPLLGICRGIQILNAVCGGTLYQDLPTQHPGVNHSMTAPYDRTVHSVTILSDTPLADILGAGQMSVNSYHHQAVKEPASCLKVSAVSEDGLIEGLYAPGKRFLHAVQWHPELVWRWPSWRRLGPSRPNGAFEALGLACSGSRVAYPHLLSGPARNRNKAVRAPMSGVQG